MEVLKTAILEMCRQEKEEFFCPSEVLKSMFPQDWNQFMEEIITVALDMEREGLIEVTQKETAFDSDLFPICEILIRGNSNQNKG